MLASIAACCVAVGSGIGPSVQRTVYDGLQRCARVLAEHVTVPLFRWSGVIPKTGHRARHVADGL